MRVRLNAFANLYDVKQFQYFRVEGQAGEWIMAAADIDTAVSDKDRPPVSSVAEKYPLTVHYCGGSWSFCSVFDMYVNVITNFS